ncbi:MAG: hypothetical protein WEC79_06715 [Thermomicrobiales bacterium]
MRNARCSQQVAEVKVQPTNDRTPGKNEEQSGLTEDLDSFELGTSFTDEPTEEGASGELPSWLQNFGGVAGDAKAPAASEDEPSMTGWNEAPRPADLRAAPVPAPSGPEPEPATQSGQGLAVGDQSFFSEDDLPEWLRALSTESEPAVSAAPVAAVSANTGQSASNGAVSIPPVSRAWVTASDVAEVSPGANLLSSLVNAIDTRPDAVAVESMTASAPPSARPSGKPQIPSLAAAQSRRDAGRWSRTRMLVVMAIIILVLFIFLLLTRS